MVDSSWLCFHRELSMLVRTCASLVPVGCIVASIGAMWDRGCNGFVVRGCTSVCKKGSPPYPSMCSSLRLSGGGRLLSGWARCVVGGASGGLMYNHL